MRVRYPEIYFLICIAGVNKDTLESYKERYEYLSHLNIVETNNMDALLHTCCELDVQEDPLLQVALEEKRKIYTFRMFDGALKEDIEIFGTPEDDILGECVVDKFTTREHYKYMSPNIEVFGDYVCYNGINLQFLNRPLN